jgi:hypothetical protein
MHKSAIASMPPVSHKGAVGAELLVAEEVQLPWIVRFGGWFTRSRVLTLVGLGLLVLVALWWKASLQRNKLYAANHVWIPAHHYLAADFQHNYYAARHWLHGGDPYLGHFGAPLEAKFSYAPSVLPLFAWCGLVSVEKAIRIWLGVLATMACLAGWSAWRTRRQLGLADVPLLLVFGVVLTSMPVVFAMERGNYDLLVIVLFAGAAAALGRRSALGDVAGGCLLALAAWIKVYPGLVVLALPLLGRRRAFLACVVAGLAMGVADLPHLRPFLENARTLARDHTPAKYGVINLSVHTVTGCWSLFWANTRLSWLTRLPGWGAWLLAALPLMGWVTWQLRRCPQGNALLYPYLCWITAVGTFLPPVSNDYNLVYLPLAALAVWDRRDPVWLHVLMAFLLLWWQPVKFGITAEMLFLFKSLGVVAVGCSLANRARELRGQENAGGEQLRSPPVATQAVAA